MASRLEDYLLPGEDPWDIGEGDVERWMAVYVRLAARTRRLIAEAETFSVAEVEISSLELYARRLEARLEFWKGQRL